MSTEFIGLNLKLARLFSKLSLQDLGESIDLSKQFLSRLEAGIERPTKVLEETLANRLEVLPDFFYYSDPMPISDEQCHFRKHLTTKVSLHQMARARGEILKRLVNILDQDLELPAYKFKETEPSSAEAIELAAERCRIDWGLGFGPIANMVRVAENAGAVVMHVRELAPEVDAISFATKRPVIALNADGKSACRARFGIAHEIGHLTLHIGVQTGDKLTEGQANRFASAFLMPRAFFISDCQRVIRGTRSLNWPVMKDIKLRWGVSKAAILYRGRQLGVFSDEQYRSGVIYLNRRGQARAEDEDKDMTIEQPEVLLDGLRVLEELNGITKLVIARRMRVKPSVVFSILNIDAIPAPILGNVLSLFKNPQCP
jgi:Zn-dependent peptidase ImmA (M78 family)